MKYFLFSIIFFSIIFFSFKRNNIDAIEYNNSVVTIQETVADEINSFIDYLLVEDSVKMIKPSQKRLDSILIRINKNITSAKKEIIKIGFFKNDSTLNRSLLEVLKEYKNGCETGYYNIGKYNLLPEEKQTDELFKRIQSEASLSDSLITIAENNFIKTQEIFALKHGLILEETEN